MGEGESGMIWKNGIEICIISYVKRVASLGSMHETRALKACALGQPRGIGQGGKWKGVSEWEKHVHPWLIHVNVWQNHHNIVK